MQCDDRALHDDYLFTPKAILTNAEIFSKQKTHQVKI